MLLYINGDSHSAGSELALGVDNNLVAFKGDDGKYWRTLGTPQAMDAHPECIKLSYGVTLAKKLKYNYLCDAVPGGSNQRIFRRFTELDIKPDLVVIGWSTWERTEFYDEVNNRWWQISAHEGKDWPETIKYKYKEYITKLDWDACMAQSHSMIYQLHLELQEKSIPHIFFNTYSYFNTNSITPVDWNNCYIDPYNPNGTFFNWCKNNGFKTVTENSFHYGKDAHDAWANYLYQMTQSTVKTI